MDSVLFCFRKDRRGHWSVHSLKLTAKGPENGWWEDNFFLLGSGPFFVGKTVKAFGIGNYTAPSSESRWPATQNFGGEK